jgi:molybdenum cofactor biosynthesis protein B
MSVSEHKADSPRRVTAAVITVSDTRTPATDASGRAIDELLLGAGHHVAGRSIVKDEPEQIRAAILRHLATPGVQVVITTGGTGITSRDSTYEVVSTLLQKRIDGFGELFRMLSYQQVGSAAMMSRAVAGIAGGRVVIALPGSEPAVRLGMEKLVLPELGHMVREAGR